MAVAIGLGAVLDAIMGDPARYHPVAGFGRFAAMLERGMWRPQRRHGVVYVGLLVGTTAALGRLAERNAVLRLLSVWTVLGGRSLGREALHLANTLERGDLEDAQRRAPVLVGRDPSVLDSDQLVRAVAQLAERGIAVRSASSFPGLGPGHLRVAVRADRDNARLVAALAEIDA
jgi:adenosylcobinamide-phosphate synthase